MKEKISDALEHRLESRPAKEDLIQHGILKGMFFLFEKKKTLSLLSLPALHILTLCSTADDTVAPSLQAAREALAREKLADQLEQRLEKRPERTDLVDHNILKGTYAVAANCMVHARVHYACACI